MSAKKPLFVQYCAADFLAGTVTLSLYAELAYRRIVDMIYNTGDRLADDDRRMPAAAKVGKRWPAVKIELLEEGKITIVDGCIRVERCTKELSRSRSLVEQRRAASQAAAEKRKALKQQGAGAPSDTPLGPQPAQATQKVNINDLAGQSDSKTVTVALGNLDSLPQGVTNRAGSGNPLKEQATTSPSGVPSDPPSDPPGGTPSGGVSDHLTVNHKERKKEGRIERDSTPPRPGQADPAPSALLKDLEEVVPGMTVGAAYAARVQAADIAEAEPGMDPSAAQVQEATRAAPQYAAAVANADARKLTEVGDHVLVLCGIQPETWIHDYHVVAAWLRAGLDPELDIYPTITRLVAHNPSFSPPRSSRGLSYFTEAILEASAKRANGADPDFDPQRSKWEGRVSGFAKRGFWIPEWGPMPGSPGCQAPPEVVIKYQASTEP